MAKPTPTFYILHGDDDFSREQALAAFRAQMSETPNGDLNTSIFDGQTASAAEVLNAVCSYPFLADRRLVIVKGLLAWIGRKGAGDAGKRALEQLAEALPELPAWSRLVFVEAETLPDSHRVLKLARELPTGYEKAFHPPQDSTGWILQRARDAYQVEIEPAAAKALALATNNDLRRADNELVKLASYVYGQDRPITPADIARLTPYVPEAKIWDMVDALALGKADDALRLLHRLLYEQDEDPLRAYGAIVRQFRLLLLTREYLDAGGSPNSLGDALGLKPYPARKAAEQARAFSLRQLETIYRALADYDLRMKTGRIEPALALDLLVAGLAR